ncbi:DUF992 domain-containing protein [Xanthobacteraceae bacterium A53D]
MPRLLVLSACVAALPSLALAQQPQQQPPAGRQMWVIEPASPATPPTAPSPVSPSTAAPATPPAAPLPPPVAAGTPPVQAQRGPMTIEDPSGKVQAGLLECRGALATAYGLGSTREVTCEFRPVAGRNQYYAGTLNRAGLDFGVSDQASMIWMVLATSAKNLGPDALAGEYVGFSSGAALGPGFSANVLVAKDASSGIALNPLSVSSDSGLSISLAAASLTLHSVPAPQR